MLQGIGVQIMAMSPTQLEEKPTNPATKETWPYPPTYFMHMPRDTRTAEYVAKDIVVLQKLVPPHPDKASCRAVLMFLLWGSYWGNRA